MSGFDSTARPKPVRWHRYADAAALAAATVDRIQTAAAAAIAKRGWFRLVLAGGGTPELSYRVLAETSEDWARWEIWFGDERCLPPEDPARNSRMAARAWLDRVPLPAANIHPIPAELGPERAAERYAAELASALPFDLVLLGMGEDGHTASLFSGQIHPSDRLVLPVHNAPKPPPDRVSLSLSALSAARELLILVSGHGKRAAVQGWRAGGDLPVAQVHCPAGIDVLIDEAADSS